MNMTAKMKEELIALINPSGDSRVIKEIFKGYLLGATPVMTFFKERRQDHLHHPEDWFSGTSPSLKFFQLPLDEGVYSYRNSVGDDFLFLVFSDGGRYALAMNKQETDFWKYYNRVELEEYEMEG